MRKLLVLILFSLIAVKAAAVALLGPVSIERDALVYWQLSTLVMGGDWLMFDEPIAYRTPAYPWFLAIIRTLAGEFALPAIVAAQSALLAASFFLAGQLSVHFTRLPRAMVWALIVALPAVSAFTFCGALLSEALFTFCLMLHLLTMVKYEQSPTSGRALLAGVTFGLTLLTRPIVVLLWLAHLPFILWSHWRNRRQPMGSRGDGPVKLRDRLGHALLATAIVMVMSGPWIARSVSIFGEPFLTEFVGRNIWVVTFQDGSGAGLDLPQTEAGEQLKRRLDRVGAADEWQWTWTVSHALIRSGLNDAQTDQLMKRVSLDAIQSNRETFSAKAIRRTINFWRTAATELPDQGAAGNYLRQVIWKYKIPILERAIQYRLSRSVLLNTLIAGLIAASCLVLLINSPSRPYGLWVVLILAYFSLVTGVLEIPHYRYRFVMEPLSAAVVGAAIAVMLSRRPKPASVVSSS